MKDMQTAVYELEVVQTINAHDKVTILLTLGGLKPAGMFYLESGDYKTSEKPRRVSEKSLEQMEGILKSMNLSYYIRRWTLTETDRNAVEWSREIVHYYISHNSETALRLKKMVEGDWQKNNYDIGLLLGYPASAVEAFSNEGDLLPFNEIPASMPNISEREVRLLGFRLSKQHWRKEISILESYGNYLRQISPRIYEEATA